MNTKSDDSPSQSFEFGPYTLIPQRQLLILDGVPVRIGGRALDILTALIERAGEIVSKRELISRVWPDTVVDDSNLKVNMVALRRALGEEAGKAPYIVTVAGRGYRFVVPVQAKQAANAAKMAFVGSQYWLPSTAHVFGRAEAIEAIQSTLYQSGLVSIVGPGGVGKTTVAIEVALAVGREYSHGAAFIDLATISAPQFLPAAIASALGLGVTSSDPLASVFHALKAQKKVLLFDNCEHLLPAVAAIVDRLAHDVEDTVILATSREPLRIRGESVYRLRGLECDPSESPGAAQACKFPAVELFAARAYERSGYRLTDADAPTVADICRRLDGNALAIELAATQTAAFSAAQILQMLGDRFRLLKLGPPNAPPRQRSLLATLDWSYGLLSEREASVLRALSVFAGAFGVDGAVAVSRADPAEIVDLLSQLAGKSLLGLDAAGELLSYRLLETTRAYCLERLQLSAEDESVRLRHAEHVCTVLERAAADWTRSTDLNWEAAFGRLIDDLRAAITWAGQEMGRRVLRIRLAAAGILLWNHLSLTEECRRYVSQAVTELDAAGQAGTPVEMQLQMSLAGNTLFSRGVTPEVLGAMRRAVDIAFHTGDTDYRLRCLRTIAACELLSGQHDSGLRTLENCGLIAAGEPSAESPAGMRERENYLAIGELFVGRLHNAKQRLERLYQADLHELKDSRLVRFLVYRNVDVGSVLSHTQWLTGSPETAARTAAAMVDAALKTKFWFSVSNCISWACPIFFLNGRYQECLAYVEMLEEQVLRHGIGVRRPIALFYRGALACTQQEVPVSGIDELVRGIEGFRAVNYLARLPFYLGVLADALARSGRLDEAETTIQSGLDSAAAQNERWCVPELLRVRAGILAAAGQRQAAETLLVESMACALDIGALAWRLRAANDLAKLWQGQSRADDARRTLLPVYSEFKEGFGTRDLLAAGALLG